MELIACPNVTITQGPCLVTKDITVSLNTLQSLESCSRLFKNINFSYFFCLLFVTEHLQTDDKSEAFTFLSRSTGMF